MAGAKAIITYDEREEFVMIPVPNKLLVKGVEGKPAATVVETMVSQQAGTSMPQSAPLLTPPEPSGARHTTLHTTYVRMSVAAGDGADVGLGAVMSRMWCH